MSADPKFVDGLIVKRRDGAPEFVLCDLSFKVDEFTAWLNANNNNGWVNTQALVSKGGKPYAQLNDWKPDENKSQSRPSYNPQPAAGQTGGSYEGELDGDIPF